MPRIRCHYIDCVFNDDGICSASAIELDPDAGCLTYSESSGILPEEWEDEDELEEDWEDLGFEDEDVDDDDWLDEDEDEDDDDF